MVLAILAVIVGVSWPALQNPWRQSRLRSAAKGLQSQLGRARVEAIESSSVLQFRYQSGTGRFAVRPGMTIALAADSAAESPALDSSASGDAGEEYLDTVEIDELEIEELPSGVVFQDPREDGIDGLSDHAATDVSAGESQSHETGLSATPADRLPWAKPVTFYPNGRVSGGRFRLADRHGYYVDVTLRGLTGTAKIGPVMRRERPNAEDAFQEEPAAQDSHETDRPSGESLPAPLEAPAPLKAPAPLVPSAGAGGSRP